MAKVLILGASENTNRYSNKAAKMLLDYNHSILCVGKTGEEICHNPIFRNIDANWPIDIVTLYLNPAHQIQYYQKIIDLKPQYVIFNPGTENSELQSLLDKEKIDWEEACTLVLLRSNQFPEVN